MAQRSDGGLPVSDAVNDSDRWHSVSWKQAVKIVKQVQARIVKAAKAGKMKRVRDLRRFLVRSRSARLMAVRRVTANRGKKTAGVDNVKWETPARKWQEARKLNREDYKPQPLKRIHIPKKNGKKRPLGIPAMRDRAESSHSLLRRNARLTIIPTDFVRSGPYMMPSKPVTTHCV